MYWRSRIMRVQTYSLLNLRNGGVWVTEADQRHPELAIRRRVIGYERNHSLEFDARLVRTVLQPPEEAERLARAKAGCIAFDCLEQQLFGARFVLLNCGAPTTGYIGAQGVSKSHLRVDRTRVDLQHLFKYPPSLLQGRRRNGSHEHGPSADHQIARVGIDCPFPLDTPAFRLHELEIDDARKPA